MNGPTFATTANPTRPQPGKPPLPGRAPLKPDLDNPALRILGYLRLHWLTILFAGALLGAGLAFAAWNFMPSKYESNALFLVAQNPNLMGNSGDPNRGRTEFNTYVKTRALLIKTNVVYSAALRNEKIRISELPTLKRERDPVKWLDENVLVSSKEGSELITMTLRGDQPDDVRSIVEAMVQAFEDEVINTERKAAGAYRDQLKRAKSTIEAQFKTKTTSGVAATDIAKGLLALPGDGGVVPAAALEPKGPAVVPAVGVGEVNADGKDKDEVRRMRAPVLNNRIITLETQVLPQLERQIVLNKTEMDGIKMAIQKVLDEAVPEEIRITIEDTDAEYKKIKSKAKQLNNEYEQKAGTVRNPSALQSLQREAEQADLDAKRLLDSKVQNVVKASRKARLEQHTTNQEKLQLGINILEMDRKQQQAQLESLRAELRNLPAPVTAEQKQIEKERKEKQITANDIDISTSGELLAKLGDQLAVADLNADTPARITVYQRASIPGQKEPLKQYLMAGAAGMMGFVMVAALLVALEMMNRKVSSLGELRAAAQVPVVGVVPWMPNEATARDPLKRADVNEAIDKLRAYVSQTWLSRGATTITVTSPLGDEGKAFTAFGLASSMAQAGSRTLLVDFDLRNPSLHAFAGLNNTLGVCDLLRGEADFRRTIQVLPNGLHFLPAGKWSDEARQAAVGGRLEALLTRLKEPFDCVVLHGHALLTVAESVEVARRSDVVLLCALFRESRVPMLKKATDRVSSMEIPFAGVVYLGATPHEALC